MTYLVTGGAGFIGSMLCRVLTEKGKDVAVLDNLSNSSEEILRKTAPKARLFKGDIRNETFVASVFKEIHPEAVCHLAAIHFIPHCNKHPIEALDINVTGTQSVISACEANPPSMVFLASTAAVYPISNEPCLESDALGPVDVYGISKVTDEMLAKLYSERTGASIIAGRIFNAVGPNETNPHVVPHLISQLNQAEYRVF